MGSVGTFPMTMNSWGSRAHHNWRWIHNEAERIMQPTANLN
jgi:hypothetical protein